MQASRLIWIVATKSHKSLFILHCLAANWWNLVLVGRKSQWLYCWLLILHSGLHTLDTQPSLDLLLCWLLDPFGPPLCQFWIWTFVNRLLCLWSCLFLASPDYYQGYSYYTWVQSAEWTHSRAWDMPNDISNSTPWVSCCCHCQQNGQSYPTTTSALSCIGWPAHSW